MVHSMPCDKASWYELPYTVWALLLVPLLVGTMYNRCTRTCTGGVSGPEMGMYYSQTMFVALPNPLLPEYLPSFPTAILVLSSIQ